MCDERKTLDVRVHSGIWLSRALIVVLTAASRPNRRNRFIGDNDSTSLYGISRERYHHHRRPCFHDLPAVDVATMHETQMCTLMRDSRVPIEDRRCLSNRTARCLIRNNARYQQPPPSIDEFPKTTMIQRPTNERIPKRPYRHRVCTDTRRSTR